MQKRAAARRADRSAVRLRSAAGRVELTLEARAGMAAVSMRVDGREWLRLPEPLAAFVTHDRTGGVPLLFPWANRLRSDRYELLGRCVDLRGMRRVHRDGSGLPMHGVLLRWSEWEVEVGAGAAAGPGPAAGARARLSWGAHRELFRAFPFDCEIELRWSLFEDGDSAAGVEFETIVRSLDHPVPLSFGWHPYLLLPTARARCRLRMPAIARVPLAHGLPIRRGGTLALEAPSALLDALPGSGIDDLFAGVHDGAVFSIEADRPSRAPGAARASPRARAISVEFVRGYPWTQIYSPKGGNYVCIEPMTAPTAALSDAAPELPILGAGQAFRAIFRIAVTA